MNCIFRFQILVHLITCVIFVVMFGYFFAASMMLDQFYWPYLVLCLLPAVKIFLIGHWGQCLEQQVRFIYHIYKTHLAKCNLTHLLSIFKMNVIFFTV